MKAFLPNTDAVVTIRVQSGFLSCGRPLPPNPVCRIRSNADSGTVLGSTQAIAFTQSPVWNEDVQFVVPSIHSAKTTFALEIVDAFSGAFLGAINSLPFNCRWPQRTTKLHRLMLLPRAGNGGDLLLLREACEDDFGHVEIAWDVQLCPIGPGPEELQPVATATSPTTTTSFDQQQQQQQSSLPLSCLLRAQWIGSLSAAPSHSTSLVAYLGSSTQPVALSGEQPLIALLRSEAESSIRLVCRHRTAMREDDVGIANFVVPTRLGGSGEKELTWCLPITPLMMMMSLSNSNENAAHDSSSGHSSAQYSSQLSGDQIGIIVLSLRLCPASSPHAGLPSGAATNPQFADRQPPNTGYGPYMPHHWEDQDHLARASERRWKKSVVTDAKAKPNHVRHLLDVMSGRMELHPAIGPHIREFFNVSPNAELRELYSPDNISRLRIFAIALAFSCDQLTIEEAVMFSMGILCSPLGSNRERRLPSMNDAVAIFEASLLPYTLDLSATELRRRVLDLFSNVTLAPEHGIDVIVFRKRFASNFGFWFVHGASQIGHRQTPQPITNMISSLAPDGSVVLPPPSSSSAAAAASSHSYALANSTTILAAASGSATGGGGGPSTSLVSANPNEDTEWLRFIIRVSKTKMGFAVTAHRDDTFAHVSAMVESTVDIPAAKQRFTFRSERVDPNMNVGSLVPPGILPQTEFNLTEISDVMALVVVWRVREKKYEIKISPHEKVLKLRSMVQQKTNIPLSRINLSYCGQVLWDRHSLDHYKLCDGAIIELTSEY